MPAAALVVAWAPSCADEGPLLTELPEPMVFDLVHSLGVESGAFEANVLALFPVGDTRNRGIDWAPEVEIAVADGVAIEFELGFDDSELEAYKFAAQFTFTETRLWQQGSHFIIEKTKAQDIWEWTGLYVLGTGLAHNWSTLSMFGLRATTGTDVDSDSELIGNVAFFNELNHRLIFGIENDLALESRDDWSLLVYPQLHYEINGSSSVQLGIGAEFSDHGTDFSAGLRVIYERPGRAK